MPFWCCLGGFYKFLIRLPYSGMRVKRTVRPKNLRFERRPVLRYSGEPPLSCQYGFYHAAVCPAADRFLYHRSRCADHIRGNSSNHGMVCPGPRTEFCISAFSAQCLFCNPHHLDERGRNLLQRHISSAAWLHVRLSRDLVGYAHRMDSFTGHRDCGLVFLETEKHLT